MDLKRFIPYISYLKPVRLQFIVGLVAGLIFAASSGFGLPLITKKLVPLLSTDTPPSGLTLILLLMSVPAVFALRAIGSFVNAYLIAYCGMHVLEQLRVRVFARLQELPLAFFQTNNVGDLMSRVQGDTQQLRGAIIKIVDSIIKEPGTLIAAAIYLIYLSIQEKNVAFILIAMISMPVCVLPIRMIGKKILKKAKISQAQAGELNHVLNENFSSIREVRAYSLEEREINRFKKACNEFFKIALKVVKYDKLLSPSIELVSAFAIVFGLYAAISMQIDEGTLSSIMVALYMCYPPIKKLGTVSNVIRKGTASLDRLEYILNAEDTVPETISPQPLTNVTGKIEFQNASFGYEAENLVLKKVNITIQSGEAIALVGPSGAGKTTFANLIPRFYDAIEGSVLIDNINVKDVSKVELRKNVALVSQDAVLFRASITDNIRIGKPDATLEEVQAACKMANAHRFIEQFEQGYETEVGERGSRLSGGQRQRLSIARAFLKNAPITILDEPTSALDAESEHQIQAALEKLSQGRTVFIIAHRFSTIQHANRILVFNKGEIIASGPHQNVYTSCELYRNLYDKQAKTVLDTPQ